MAARKCTYLGCDGKYHARGLCNKHWIRERRAGRLAPRTLKQRFHEKYEVCPDTGCWLWTASTRGGYGAINVDGSKLAHRLSWELHVGPIPEGLHVLHRCDTPSCVNPDHLMLGTHQDNMTDKMQKGRHVSVKGSAQGTSKLTEEQALEIYHAEGLQREIAEQYGVAQSRVSAIKLKKIWRHIHG